MVLSDVLEMRAVGVRDLDVADVADVARLAAEHEPLAVGRPVRIAGMDAPRGHLAQVRPIRADREHSRLLADEPARLVIAELVAALDEVERDPGAVGGEPGELLPTGPVGQ